MPETLAIYPSARKVLSVLKEESRSRVLLGHSTMTIKELVERLWPDLDDPRAVLSPSGERLAVETVMREQRLAEQAGLESSPGLIESVVGTIRQLKSAAIEPADLFGACDDATRSEFAPHEIGRIKWIGGAFDAYEKLLAARALADGHDRERAVVDELHRAERDGHRPRLLHGVTRLQVAEIYDLSLLQYMLIASLIRLLGEATITIQAAPHDANDANFPGLTWNRFVEDESIANQSLPDFVRRGGRAGRLDFVLEHIFAPNPPPPPPPDATVRIIEAPTRPREFEQVARSIRGVLERAGNDNVALDRIAIVARDMAPFADDLGAVMGRYGIALDLADRPSLTRSPVGRLVLALLRMPLDGFRREALISMLASGFVSHSASRFRSVVSDAGYIDESTKPLEECIASLCARLSDELAAPELDSQRRGAIERSLESAGRSRAAFSNLLALLRALAGPATFASHVDRLRSTLTELGFAESTAVDVNDETYRHIAALNSLLDALAHDALLVSADRVASADEFAAVAELALSEAAPDVYPTEAAGAVKALSVEDARGLDFDLVYVIGLNDEVFPRYHSEDPLIDDELKIKLNRPFAALLGKRLSPHAPPILGRILRTRYEYNRSDAFLFYLSLSMPARELVLTYTSADARGAP
ncbi:MAG: PD-(D/E)XK nuclease family protein, partial [Candidatus Binataceae bacterium]